MSTKTWVPIKIEGRVVIENLRVTRVEFSKVGWDWSPIEIVGPGIGSEDDMVVVFEDPMPDDPDDAVSYEYDTDVVEMARKVVQNQSLTEVPWEEWKL